MKYLLYISLFFTNVVSASVIDTVPNTMGFGHVSSSWNDEEYADPSEGITYISPPSANVTGTASLSFPITLPAGRQGMQPSLSISYDSEETSTWCGFGWNLAVSTISLDTRWGVPGFYDDIESEVYLLEGEQMGPVFHRAAEYPREAERTFILRQNTDFQNIVRHGNHPENYWWEVTEKSGIKKYYGGTPETGLADAHVLTSPRGITHWYLMKTIDPNGNNIIYNYQSIVGGNGVNKYLANIIYTGHEDSMGNYSVHFSLDASPRSDKTVSGRHGFLISEERLLNRIEVRFKEQQIRAYVLNYETGVFGKTLLQSVNVYDQEDALFYNYGFEYFNDLEENSTINAYTAPSSWNVQNESGIPVGNITGNIDGFNAKPTLLGSAISKSEGAGASVTVGPISPPHTKDFTVGPNGGFTNNNSEGLTALIDIDGDGLPDKLWKEDDGLYYRSNQMAGNNPSESFGSATKITGVFNFSKSNTLSWNVGAELNLPPVYAGYTHEEGTTKTTTYFVDFNGDELMDIVNEGEVFFNYLVDGVPHFSNDVSLTESMIYKGAGLDPGLIEFDPDEQSELENQNPLHDVVRTWRAPYDGTVEILAPVNLVEDNSPESIAYETKDGVRVSIQRENTMLWENDIAAEDFTVYNPTNVASVSVSKGDFIYFRVHSIFDGSYDEVNWDPTINYINDYNYVDAENLAYNSYSASDDFLLEEKKSIVLNQDGVIQISSKVFKPILSDHVELRISGDFTFSWVIDMKEAVDSMWVLSNIPVSTNDELNFSIHSVSNVNWSEIVWEPEFEYTEFADGSEVTNDDGTPIYSDCAIVDYHGYFNNHFLGQPSNVENYDSIDLDVFFSTYTFGLLSVKLVGEVDTAYSFEVTGFPELSTKIDVSKANIIYIDLLMDEQPVDPIWLAPTAMISENGVSNLVTCGVWNNLEIDDGKFGSLYRGWGQFIYDGNNGRGDLPINLEGLEYDEDELENDTLQVDENSGSTDLEGTGNNGELIIAMTSDPKLKAWRGTDEFAFISEGKMGSTRRGQKYVSAGGFNTGSGDMFSSPELISKYYSNGGFGGLGVPGTSVSGSAGFTAATTYSVLDIADFNGDRYPDIIGEKSIQLTNFRGGLTNSMIPFDWGIHEAYSEAISVGVGLNPGSTSAKNAGGSMGAGTSKRSVRFRQKGRANSSKARSSFESASEAVGLSANVGSDSDHAIHSFLDLNGDGLEDKVWENGDVALNLGYSFAPIQNWGFTTIRSGDALDFGAGLGLNISNGSILGGVSATKTDNGSKTGFVDLNGDALLDLIVSSDPIMVRFNTGTGFAPAVNWLELAEFDRGVALGESVNAGFTFSIIIFFVKISFNVQGFIGQGTGSTYEAFLDLNGDGYADYLSAESGNDNLTARYSTIGRSNLLQSIQYPLGAELTLDYEIQGNNENLPYSRWSLTAFTLYDGLEGDGSDYMHSEYSYEGGFHDRHDRQFLGFKEVTSSQFSGETKVKKLVQTFHVENYYTKGLISSVELYDSKDILQKSIQFDYAYRDVENGSILPPDYIDSDNGMVYPSLSQETVVFTEGTTDKTVELNYLFEYDSLGNLTKQIETDINGYYKEIQWEYKTDFANEIRNKVLKEQVFGGSQLLRESSYTYDNRGNRLSNTAKIEEGIFATTSFAYDAFGNELTITNPENSNSERLEISMIYDSENHQFLTLRTDSYGYSESYTNELLYGTITKYVDNNGNSYSYGVDSKGRPAFSLNPIDSLAGESYSVQYEYFPGATNPHAICSHNVPNEAQDIRTFSFFDGNHNVVQTKTPALISVNGNEQQMYVVSGKSILDSLGRTQRKYLSIVESLGNQTSYNNSNTAVNSTQFSYDVNDRFISVQHIEGGTTTYEYDIEIGQGKQLLKATQTNPNGLVTDFLYSSRGELLLHRKTMPGESSETKYEYDELSYIKTITHPSGFATEYGYDLLGRRIFVDVPDAGVTELVYDKTNNLLHKVTANIRDGLQENASIRYNYEQERLVSIDYPKNFQNKVLVSYGEPGANHNRAGRIWLQQDGTGGREYFYDVFGNVRKEIRTVIINRSEIYTYITEMEHDAFNRITKLIYPDGEVLEYFYDETSRLDRIVGSKANDEYVYVNNVHYDQYLEMIKLDYGNGVEDAIQYDDKTRITKQQLRNEQGELYNASFTYDYEDNVLTHNNSLANELSGEFNITNTYDERNRLVYSEGTWSKASNNSEYTTFFDYNPSNRLTMKGQELKINDVVDPLKSRNYDYEYQYDNYPSRPSTVAGKDYSYDLNGNLDLVNSQTVFDFTQYVYDEENRMTGASVNGRTSLYTYDAFGRRAIKSQGSIQGIFINGAPAGLLEHNKNYRVEVSPYFTVFEHGYRKHFFIDNKRIASKIGTGVFNTNLSEVPYLTAGGLDYKARIQAYEDQILEYYANSGVPPGPPTLLALLGQPEFNQVGFENLSDNAYNALPPNWPQLNEPDSTGPPGSPIFYVQDGINNDNVEAGYNFTNGQITKELEQFFYHYDPRQNIHLVTGSDGVPRQHKMYLPSGESWISKALHIDSSAYAMAGYLFDEETGMYYMGEVYYDPVSNIELSVDKIEQTFGVNTVNSRIEGNLFYDFADFQEDVDFDQQIINSEKPNPLISGAASVVDNIRNKGDGFTFDLRGPSAFEKKRKKFQTQLPKSAQSLSFVEIMDTYENKNVEIPETVELLDESPKRKKKVTFKIEKSKGETKVKKKRKRRKTKRKVKRKRRKTKSVAPRKT